MKKQILALAAASTLLLAASSSFADTVDAGDLNYSILLEGTCTADLTQPALGTQAIAAGIVSDLPGGTINVTCTNGMAYGVCVHGGSNATAGTRQLAGVAPLDPLADFLVYDLMVGVASVGDDGCQTAGGLALVDNADWATGLGVTAAGVINGTLQGSGVAQPYVLLADVTIPVPAKAGTYEDTVAVSVIW